MNIFIPFETTLVKAGNTSFRELLHVSLVSVCCNATNGQQEVEGSVVFLVTWRIILASKWLTTMASIYIYISPPTGVAGPLPNGYEDGL